jgi:DNA repair ATPase RecN
MLVNLSTSRQVVAISHLAQVAIGAKSHYVAKKQQINENMCATMALVDNNNDRAKEIARLMCGIINEETQKQAIALLCHQD